MMTTDRWLVLLGVLSALGLVIGWLIGAWRKDQCRQAAYLDGCDDGAADERQMWESRRDKSIWDHRMDLGDATEALLAEADAVLSAALPNAERRALPMTFDDETGTWEAVTAQLRAVPA